MGQNQDHGGYANGITAGRREMANEILAAINDGVDMMAIFTLCTKQASDEAIAARGERCLGE